MGQAAEFWIPLRTAKVVQTDDSPVKVLDPSLPKV
jgi:hypothetical protein